MVVRRLRPVDVPVVAALIHSIGWGQTASDVENLLSREECRALGSYEEAGFEDGPGELLSIAALQCFDEPQSREETRGYGWLCYVATEPHARRKGLAGALITMLLSAAPVGTSLGLYGSAVGAPLYEKRFGFVDRGHAQFMSLGSDALRSIQPPTALPPGCSLAPASEVLPGVLALDQTVYGVDRSQELSRWACVEPATGQTRRACWALVSGGDVVGFVLGRAMHPGERIFLGPLIARTEDEAEVLLHAALSALSDDIEEVSMLVLDVGGPAGEIYGEGSALADRVGFERVGAVPSRLMTRGPSGSGPGSIAWVDRLPRARAENLPRPFAAAGYEFG